MLEQITQSLSYTAVAFEALPRFIAAMETRDVVDILVVAVLIYLVLLFIKQTRSFFIFNSFLVLLLIIYLSKNLDLTLTRQIFQPLLTFFIVIFVVVFQREIRRFFDWFSIRSKNLSLFQKISLSTEVSNLIVKAVYLMAGTRTGAIIVLPGEYPLDDMVEGGLPLDGKVSVNLLLSIFDTGSPGHDGAVLIKDHRIKMFGLHLPLAEDFKGYNRLGTRHRAAAGITERSDALAIVVSEERGTVSLAEGGVLTEIRDMDELEEKIKLFLKENIIESNLSFWHYVFIKNFFTKISSLVLAALLWFFFVFQTGTVTAEYQIPVEFRFLPRQYVIENVVPQEVSIRVSGKNSDIGDLDLQTLRATIDASRLETGWQRVTLTKNSITAPAYVDIVQIEPEAISITIATSTEI
jgi:diadenylate cyclase